MEQVAAETGEGISSLDPLSAFCSLVVVMLELPCFWFTMAMAAAPDFLEEMRPRVTAYATIVLPLLAVSAMAESYAVTRPFLGGTSD